MLISPVFFSRCAVAGDDTDTIPRISIGTKPGKKKLRPGYQREENDFNQNLLYNKCKRLKLRFGTD